MIRAVTYTVSVLLNFSIVLLLINNAFSDSVEFDCPALLPATLVDYGSSHQIVELRLPVTASQLDSKLELSELRVAVSWNRSPYPVVDFAPRTTLQSKFDGPVSVEKRTETNYGIGAKVSTSYIDFLTPSIDAEIGKKNSETKRFQEIPQHDVLLSSGTADRGTGVKYRFRPARTETLEGSRDLVVAFEVPSSWRGGVLQVTLTAIGERKKVGGFAAFGSTSDAFEFSRVFVLPIYLEGDDQARQFAVEFSQTEQQLRRKWQLYETRGQNSVSQFRKWLGTENNAVPGKWMHHLIQSGSDSAIRKYESKLPKLVATAANDFVAARKNLLALSR